MGDLKLPCIVGKLGRYRILQLYSPVKPTGNSLNDIGVRLETCTWMTRELFEAFFDANKKYKTEAKPPSSCLKVTQVDANSAGSIAGLLKNDLLVYSTSEKWKLVPPDLLSTVLAVSKRLYVARLIVNDNDDVTSGFPDYDYMPDSLNLETKLPAKSSLLVDEDAVQAVLSIPSQRPTMPTPSKSDPPVAVLRSEMGVNDVVLGAGGYDQGIYRDCIQAWWQRYELATHSRKRDVCKHVISEMIRKGVRFLVRVDDGSRGGYYTVEPADSTKISNKVLRALRQEVLDRTEHLDNTERNHRHMKITAVRKEARMRERRDEEVAARAMTSLAHTIADSATAATNTESSPATTDKAAKKTDV